MAAVYTVAALLHRNEGTERHSKSELNRNATRRVVSCSKGRARDCKWTLLSPCAAAAIKSWTTSMQTGQAALGGEHVSGQPGIADGCRPAARGLGWMADSQ